MADPGERSFNDPLFGKHEETVQFIVLLNIMATSRKAVSRPEAKQPAQPESAPAFYPELESLRGVAALTVVIFHVLRWRGLDHYDIGSLSRSDVLTLLLTTIFNGTGAVSLFFVLSGFVLTYRVSATFTVTPSSYGSFAIKRAFRLLPTAWLSLFAAALIWHHRLSPIGYRELLDGMAFDINAIVRLNGPLWSVYVEIWVCLFLPFLFVLNCRISATARLAVVASLMWLSVTNGTPYWLSFAYCFQLGAMIPDIIPAIVRMKPGVAGALAICSLLGILLSTNISRLGWLGVKEHTAIEALSAMVLIAYLISNRRRAITKYLLLPVTLFLGRISYSLYVFHYLIINLLAAKLISSTVTFGTEMLGLIAGVPICIAVGWISYRLVEHPCQRIGRKLAARIA